MKKERTIILLFTILALVFTHGLCIAQTKRTIHVATAGTLSSYISESEKYQIEELTLTGEINGTDFRLLREMSGRDLDGVQTNGRLAVLDLSGVKIIAGGFSYYIFDDGIDVPPYALYFDDIIPSHVFDGCSSLLSIIIPNGVTSIGEGAFSRCSGLTSITIPNSVASIEYGAFSGCSGLTSITIPNSVTSIGYEAFYGCSGLTSIKVEDNNAKYDSRNNCNAIIEKSSNTLIVGCKNTIIPNSVTSIGVSAFRDCSGLTSITIPNSVTSIGNYAFSGCSGLTSITIPNSVTSIGYYAFSGCSGLTSIVSEIESPFTIGDNTFYSDDKDIYSIATLTVPAGKRTKYQSTSGWNKFKNIVEASGGSSEDVRKFESGGITYNVNDNGTTVTVTAGSTKYKGSISIPSSVSYNGKTYDVTSIGYAAFSDCTGLTSISIPNSVMYIQYGAFQNCSGLSSITLPKSIKSIAQYAFIGCSSLTKIVSEIESPFSLEGSTFDNSTFSNATLTVPAGTKSLYQSTGGWKNFKNIVEAGSNEVQTKRKIHVSSAGTLSNCISESEKYQIEELTLTGEINGSDLGFLRKMAGKTGYSDHLSTPVFDDTEGKLSVLDLSGVKIVAGGGYMKWDGIDNNFSWVLANDNEIPPSVFAGCKGLTSIIIPESINIIGQGAFSDTGWYKSQPDGMVYIGKVAYTYKGDMPQNTQITIKDGTKSIACSAFIDRPNLTSVNIPNSVTYIGGINEEIGPCAHRGAFENCTGLTSVTMPNNLTTIGRNAFLGCSSLTYITIPGGVTAIGGSAFAGCSGLTSIVSEIENPFAIDDNTFYSYDKDIYATATLTVPAGTKTKYQATEGWKLFKNIVEAATTDEVEFSLSGTIYHGSKSTKSIIVKSIDASQISVEIPASVSYDGMTYQVTGIDDNAFSGCTMAALIWDVEVALPYNVFSNASIGSNFLLYVKSASYAPSSVKNVVVNGTAQAIVLSDDGGQFYCPQAFTADKISYTHNYNMETGGDGKGWETIALPFNVQKISHSTRGEIIPFASYSSGSSEKPFWLANQASNGFRRTSNIQSNEPYIIAMPNNSSYRNDYILAGDVTFYAENASVPKTPSFSGKFIPAYSTVKKASNIYAINAVNRYVSETGGYDAGSRFISNLRDVRPFEAYMSDSSTRGIIEIASGDGTTGMDEILGFADSDREIDIYTLNGQKVMQTKQHDLEATMNQLPHGVYIVNGKKLVR